MIPFPSGVYTWKISENLSSRLPRRWLRGIALRWVALESIMKAGQENLSMTYEKWIRKDTRRCCRKRLSGLLVELWQQHSRQYSTIRPCHLGGVYFISSNRTSIGNSLLKTPAYRGSLRCLDWFNLDSRVLLTVSNFSREVTLGLEAHHWELDTLLVGLVGRFYACTSDRWKVPPVVSLPTRNSTCYTPSSSRGRNCKHAQKRVCKLFS